MKFNSFIYLLLGNNIEFKKSNNNVNPVLVEANTFFKGNIIYWWNNKKGLALNFHIVHFSLKLKCI
jgi:hypothetical protein